MKFKDGWYAKDPNQDIYWYGEMPEKGNNCWYNGASARFSDCIQIDGPWEDSLYKVEDGVITKVTVYKKDQKVLVSDDRIVWYRRYYSHFEDGKHFVFTTGKTSWTQEGKTLFRFIKPAEEE